MSELADRLNDHLREVSQKAQREAPPDPQSSINAAYAALAREVERQMEWVRDQCAEEVGGAAEDTHESINGLELTIAPDDWKPPKHL